MIRKVTVTKTGNPDDGYTDKNELLNDVQKHRNDVSECMNMLSMHLKEIGEKHDWTKIAYFNDFARDTLERKDEPDFKKREWYNIHTSQERHHLNSNIPVDVDLFDVLEFLVDCIVAGKTRSGDVNIEYITLPQSVINTAYWNTVKKIDENIIIKKEE